MKSVKRSTLLVIGIVFAIMLAASTPAIFCDVRYLYHLSACEAFQRTPVVFLGTAIEELQFGIRFHVDLNYKGATGDTLDVFSELMDGIYPRFEKGKQYVVYASLFPVRGLYFIYRTNLIEDASEDMAFLQWFDKGNAFGYISGTIRIFPDDYRDSATDQLLYSHKQFNGTRYLPLGKRLIKLRTNDKEFSLTTNENGQFSIGGLPAGLYRIAVPGYSIRLEPEIISLPQNGCSDVNLFVKATP